MAPVTGADLDAKLDFSLKYNWWTPALKKDAISLSARLEYIMKYGSFDELVFLFKHVDTKEIIRTFHILKKDTYHWNKKRIFMIEHLITLYRNLRENAVK